ncbi:MAG: OmpA family protein, partial [Pseudomonadota bacterium]|nr:OmpA family protein [Pseudomonadota bacterium]
YLTLVVAIGAFHCAYAQEPALRETLFKEADEALGAAQAVDARLLSPNHFVDGAKAYLNAENDFERGRSLNRITGQLTSAIEAFTKAKEAAENASIGLAPLIQAREDAITALAESFAADLWNEAEELFRESARNLETGNAESATERAEKAESLYRDAELEGIKAQHLSHTRSLIAQAEQIGVPQYAPKTFAIAKSLLDQAEAELNKNRYEVGLPGELTEQADYETRHAELIANYIRRAGTETWSVEDIIMLYEQSILEIAAAADKTLMLDKGSEPAANEMVDYIRMLHNREQQMQADIKNEQQRNTGLEEEIRDLDEQLGTLYQERSLLIQRIEDEARTKDQFAKINTIFTPQEARVSREGNDIILRLLGLSFESGGIDIRDTHDPLLQKVREAVEVFPRSRVTVEGHTDSRGGARSNMVLSRNRAEAVAQHLTNKFALPAHRISAVGYGQTQPIANNETEQGRANNRRINIRIEP